MRGVNFRGPFAKRPSTGNGGKKSCQRHLSIEAGEMSVDMLHRKNFSDTFSGPTHHPTRSPGLLLFPFRRLLSALPATASAHNAAPTWPTGSSPPTAVLTQS